MCIQYSNDGAYPAYRYMKIKLNISEESQTFWDAEQDQTNNFNYSTI